MTILVIGYYGHSNAGDEQYKKSFCELISRLMKSPERAEASEYCPISFIDCDKIHERVILDTDIVIVGGGDILNDYFLDKINQIFQFLPNKILAVSVGMPYIDIVIHTTKLNIFDYIFIRNKQDMSILQRYYSPDRVFYLPDISYFLRREATPRVSSRGWFRQFPNIFGWKTIYDVAGAIAKATNLYPEPLAAKDIKGDAITQKIESWYHQGKKIVCFALNRHIYHPMGGKYQDIIEEMSIVVEYLILQDYCVVFLPFNTKEHDSDMENDILIHNDVMEKIIKKISYKRIQNQIMNIQCPPPPPSAAAAGANLYPEPFAGPDIYSLYKYFYLVIPMRFHACLYSIYEKVPFLPIYTTNKIKKLLLDIQWEYEYRLETDADDLPIRMKAREVISFIEQIITHHSVLVRHLSDACEIIEQDLNLQLPILKDILFHASPSSAFMDIEYRRSEAVLPERTEACHKSNNTIIYDVAEPISKTQAAPDVENRTNDRIIESLLEKIEEICGGGEGGVVVLENSLYFTKPLSDTKKQDIITAVSFFLTKNCYSKYNDGLMEKMFQCLSTSSPERTEGYRYKEEWMWVIRDNLIHRPYIPSHPKGLFNLTYIDQIDYSNVHRSGWQYVYNNMIHYHNENSLLYLDLYVDRTFHWEFRKYEMLGVIPYTNDWIGFVHHTFDNQFSKYNNHNLLKNPCFLESLLFCKGLFVLSTNMKRQFEYEFLMKNIQVPVFVLTHPTESKNVLPFSWKKYKENPDKKLLHIGGWLRNIFAFYHLSLPRRSGKEEGMMLRKVAVKNTNMSNYFPQESFVDSIHFFLRNEELNVERNYFLCSDDQSIKNNWYKHLYEYIERMFDTMDVIDKLNNVEYDELLSENVVFLNLVDAAAVNTIIECIVRNTPIVVNRHPGVVELLGEKYPLYYEDDVSYFEINMQVFYLLSDRRKIRNAHRYLAKMDKTRFTIHHFMGEFIRLVKTLK